MTTATMMGYGCACGNLCVRSLNDLYLQPCEQCGRDLNEQVYGGPQESEGREWVVCCVCRKPIRERHQLAHQGGSASHPCHKQCRIEIKRSSDGGI